ncbi:MAG: zinc ribbon domain-containing protein [Desulfotomaculaceae bacterium]|nr:zinc ribbon domain-containing protein [Desulfotomaculaceae bacterium]
MEIFKKVSEGARSITEGAKTIGKKSGDLVETTRLKMEISKLEKEMENNITALGNLVYMQYKGDEGLKEEIDRLLLSTRALESDIDEINDQIIKINPKPPACANCHEELPQNVKFCPNCGTKVPEVEKPAE